MSSVSSAGGVAAFEVTATPKITICSYIQHSVLSVPCQSHTTIHLLPPPILRSCHLVHQQESLTPIISVSDPPRVRQCFSRIGCEWWCWRKKGAVLPPPLPEKDAGFNSKPDGRCWREVVQKKSMCNLIYYHPLLQPTPPPPTPRKAPP